MAKRASIQKVNKAADRPRGAGSITLKFTLIYPVYSRRGLEHKVLIAGMLNELVHKGQLVIYGYLITATELYLVPACDKKDIGAIQKLVADALRKIIRRDKGAGTAITKVIDLYPADLRATMMEDAQVTSLLTGGRLKSPYSNYYYVKLQKQVQTEEFSSAIEYIGGVGPVVMTCKPN
ncbi:hypothetical protein GWR56_13260 [Mucilaginibacter sp. 14171R-50]|uniref:hypothetical protein n=1 Tax=Mucilaginibacter sp. 14171R-50 TaxID=2703789 RepID=UPI00138B1CE4|nr:hypothetical protein [Mucilaginibacter sp. 14171R-50]QHS56459.1 hypothetical protein GWR56_13260 [Mucilaginibacter sp. 14171R-50]